MEMQASASTVNKDACVKTAKVAQYVSITNENQSVGSVEGVKFASTARSDHIAKLVVEVAYAGITEKREDAQFAILWATLQALLAVGYTKS